MEDESVCEIGNITFMLEGKNGKITGQRYDLIRYWIDRTGEKPRDGW